MSDGPRNAVRKKRIRVRFSLAMALSALTLVCIALAWFNWTQRFARAASAMEQMKIAVSYDAASNNREKPQRHKVPQWKAQVFGEDYCFRMNRLDIGGSSVAASPTFWRDLEKHKSAMPAVEVVGLYGVDVNAEVIDVLAKLPLIEIYFSNCKLKKGVLQQLEKFPRLQTVLLLELEQDLDYRTLSRVRQLTQIGFENCKIDLETAEYLRAKLPGAYVFALRSEK